MPRIALLLFTLQLTFLCYSQPNSCEISWAAPIRLSFDSVLSISPRVVIDGDTVHVMWFGIDTIGGIPHSGVEYSRSIDGGVSFSLPVTLAPASDALNPGVIASSGGVVYVSYQGIVGSSFGTVLVRSTNAGATWEPARLLRANSFPLLIAALNGGVYIHFSEQRTFGMLGSEDYGLVWSVLSINAPLLRDMKLTSSLFHAVGEYDLGLHHETGYFYSFNKGASWIGPETVSREDGVASILPQLDVNEDETIYVVWNDTGSVTLRKTIGYNEDDELIWSPEISISEDRGAIFPDIAASRSFVSVAWDNDFGGTGGIRLGPSNNNGDSFCPTDAPSTSNQASEPSIKISGNIAHLVWAETIQGDGEIFYRRGLLKEDLRPKRFALKQNYPNPFNGVTRIAYDLSIPSFVTVRVYNTLGQLVLTLVDGYQEAAKYEVLLSANNLASGMYFYELRTLAFKETKKLIIMR